MQAFKFVLLLFAAGAGLVVHAQAPGPPDPVAIPIDGGLSIFLGLGAAYGAKRIYDTVKEKDRDST